MRWEGDVGGRHCAFDAAASSIGGGMRWVRDGSADGRLLFMADPAPPAAGRWCTPASPHRTWKSCLLPYLADALALSIACPSMFSAVPRNPSPSAAQNLLQSPTSLLVSLKVLTRGLVTSSHLQVRHPQPSLSGQPTPAPRIPAAGSPSALAQSSFRTLALRTPSEPLLHTVDLLDPHSQARSFVGAPLWPLLDLAPPPPSRSELLPGTEH